LKIDELKQIGDELKKCNDLLVNDLQIEFKKIFVSYLTYKDDADLVDNYE